MKGMKVSGPWEVVLVVTVCICAFFVNNRVITPDIMESRNIIAAREMAYDGHWITPTMNGDLRLEKPHRHCATLGPAAVTVVKARGFCSLPAFPPVIPTQRAAFSRMQPFPITNPAIVSSRIISTT